MRQRSLLKSQLPLASDLQPRSSRFCFALSILLSTIFVMPMAQAANCKLPKSYYKNVSCTSSSGYFLAVKDFGAPVALLDSQGKKVLDLLRYQKVDADKISSGLLPVLRNSHVGYVNMQGREVVPTIYDMLKEKQGWARPVSEGRIVVKKDGNYGVISTSNDTIGPFSAAISDIDNYRGGVARVRKNQATSWLDKNGKATSNPNAKSDRSDSSSASNKAALLSPQASPSRPPTPPSFTTLQPHQQDGRWGFVDEKNVTMITYAFDEVRPFSEGLAAVRIDDNWGFVNLGGELVIPFQFDKNGVADGNKDKGEPAFVFTDGKAWVGSLKNGGKICTDKEGEIVSCA